ncbi:MAG: PKD domain-containing protein [Thermoplasmata archaeon]|nr:PKD domain-containing protein [Thermoplasmata archaeon]
MDTVTIEVHANGLPVVEITPTPAVVMGDTVSFDAEVSDEDGDTLTFLWDFGDDGISTWEAAKHIFVEPGTYTVTLTVTDSEGGVTVRTIEVVVEKPKKDDDDESPGFGTVIVMVSLASALVLLRRRR